MFDVNFGYEFYETNSYYSKGRIEIKERFADSHFSRYFDHATVEPDATEYSKKYEKYRYNKKKRIFCRLMGIVPDVKFAKVIEDASEMENYTLYDWDKYVHDKYSVWEMFEYLPLTIESKEEVSKVIFDDYYIPNMSVSGYTLNVPVSKSYTDNLRNKFTFFFAFFVFFNLYLNKVEITEHFLYFITDKFFYYNTEICDNLFINYFYLDWVLKKADKIVADINMIASAEFNSVYGNAYLRSRLKLGVYNQIFPLGFAKASWNYELRPLDKHLLCLLAETTKIKLAEDMELDLNLHKNIEYRNLHKLTDRIPGLNRFCTFLFFTWFDPCYLWYGDNYLRYVDQKLVNKPNYFLPPRLAIYETVSDNKNWGGRNFFDSLFYVRDDLFPIYRADYSEYITIHWGTQNDMIPWVFYEHPNVIEYFRTTPITKRVYNFSIPDKFKFKFKMPFILKNNIFYDYLLLLRVSIVNEFKKSYYAQLLLKKIDIDFNRVFKDIKNLVISFYGNLVSFYKTLVELFNNLVDAIVYILDIRNLKKLPLDTLKALMQAWNPDLVFKIAPPKDGKYVKDIYYFNDKENFFKSRIKNSNDKIFNYPIEKKVYLRLKSIDNYPSCYSIKEQIRFSGRWTTQEMIDQYRKEAISLNSKLLKKWEAHLEKKRKWDLFFKKWDLFFKKLKIEFYNLFIDR